MTYQAPDARRKATARRTRGPTLLSLPRAISGPFMLNVDSLFDRARSAVCARPELVDQLEVLQEPPDLAAVIAGQRELLLSSVTEQEDRAQKVGTRLHELLVARLAVDPDQIDELDALTTGTEVLRDAIRAIDEDMPTDGAKLASPARERLANWLLTIQPYRQEVEAWLHAPGSKKPRRRPVLSPPATQPSTDLPNDLLAALRQEQSECRRVVTEIERKEEDMLARQLSAAREQPEFRAQVTDWESQQRDIVQTLESAMLSVALTALNSALAAASAPRMSAFSIDGLRSTLTDEKIVITAPFERLEAMIQQRRDGSFGIAGPRGVGKTTLIRFFATGPGLRKRESNQGDESTDHQRPRLGVVVSAPVRYEARDFVLHLYAELCKRVAGKDADQAILYRQRTLDRDSGWDSVFPAALQIGMAVFGAGAVTGGIGLLVWTISRRLASSTHTLADIGAALIGTAAILLAILLFRALRIAGTTVRLRRITFHDEMSSPSADAPIRQTGLHLSRLATWSCAAMSALTIAGITLLLAGGGWPGGIWPLIGGAVLLAAGMPVLWSVRRVSRILTFTSIGPISFGELEPSYDTQLRELALDHLRQIRFQQSFSSERSMTVKFSGPKPVPVGIDAAGKQGTTWEERPKSYPELVADLRAFLAATGEKYELVIGIDELDKLRSPEAVEEFLNDIKGIFGATGCFYLVSVSEDAAASFERRGTPFRDVFDSSFDDVISVQHLDLVSARKILHGLLLGWTEPFVGLCYVLSGGLARDLWRVARELVAQRDGNNEIELAQAALALCRGEGEARLQAVRHELMREPFDTYSIGLLSRIADLTLTDATAADMRRWHEDLRTWAASAKPPTPVAPGAEDATEPFPTKDESKPPAATRTTASYRLALEMAAYLLFAATVLDFFIPTLIGDRLHDAEDTVANPKALATLASARQSLSLSPSGSLVSTERFRKEWRL